jgi:hypothetical protein
MASLPLVAITSVAEPGDRPLDVGPGLEPVVAPSRSRSLRRRLLLPVGATGLMHVVLAAGDRLPSVDGLTYLEAGRNLLGGDGYTRFGAPELHFPPLVPVSLRVLELLTGSEMAALGLWNVISGLAVLATLVGLAHRLWRDDSVTVAVAWLGGTMTGLSPMFFRHGSGSEGASLALLLGAVLVALPAFEEGPAAAGHVSRAVRPVRLVGSGLLVGLAYLVRPEALLSGLLVGLAAGAWAWRRPGGRVGVRLPVTAGGAFLVGAMVLIGPYVAYLHSDTGSWSLTAKSQDVSIEAWRAVAEGDRRERDQYLYALTPDGTGLGGETHSLTELAADHPAAWLGIVRINAVRVVRTYLAPLWGYGLAWEAVPAPLLLLALVELWRERRRRTIWLLTGMALVTVVTCLVFFTLPRYLALSSAVLTLLAAKGLVGWQRRLPRRWGTALATGAVLLVAMSTLTEVRSLLPGRRTADPVAHQEVGLWLASHTPPDARVMTRSFHVQAYADRPIVALPAADYASTLGFARLMGVTYVVVDQRSPLYEPLRRGPPQPGLRLVALIGAPTRPLRVYELDPPAPPSQREPIPLGYMGD